MVRRVVVILLTIFAAGAVNAQTVKEIKRQKNEVQAEIKETSKMLKSNKTATRKTLNQLNRIQGDIEAQQSAIVDLQNQIDSIESKITALNEEIARTDAQLAKLRNNYLAAIKKMRAHRCDNNQLMFLLSSGTFHEAYRRMRYLKEFSRWREQRSSEIEATQARLNEEKRSLESLHAEKNRTVATVNSNKLSLETKRSEQAKIVDRLRAEAVDLAQVLREKEAASRALDQRLNKIIEEEERRFFLTLSKGMEILDAAIAGSKDGVLDGEVVFKLHDTYGFPADLTGDVCRERDVKIDFDGFDAAMARQREAARASAKFKMAAGLEYTGADTVFTGYETLEENEATVLAVYKDGQAVELAEAGDDCIVVFDRTPFYAEQGGQVGDRGHCRNDASLAGVLDTIRVKGKVTGHSCHVEEGRIAVGDKFRLTVDADRRHATQRNHSATHLLQQALRKVLGEHVEQKGSLVSPTELRFDFSHSQAMTTEQIARVEDLVNEQILANTATKAEVLPLEEARKTGATMLFGEKYGDIVRVETIGNSVELCGGTHVVRTGDIGSFKILGEAGVAAGIRRIEAVTGMNALAEAQKNAALLGQAAFRFNVKACDLPSKIDDMMANVKALEKQLEQLKSQMASRMGDTLLEKAIEVKGIKVLAARMDGADAKALRETMDKVKDKLGTAVAVLAAVSAEGRVQLAAGVSRDLTDRVKAGELVNSVAQKLGGKGGGKPDMAMAGAQSAEGLDAALADVQAWVEAKL